MRFLALFCFISFVSFAQNIGLDEKLNKIKIEDKNGCLITDAAQRQLYFAKKIRQSDSLAQVSRRSALVQVSSPLCSNGGFEEFEAVGGFNMLKNFAYMPGDPDNPIQCKSIFGTANQGIQQYDPAITTAMASTVPANFIDEYIGNINGFDQFCLKVNYEHSGGITLGVVQAKRFKTNNENKLQFNYKVVLQSIYDSDHDNEQPYFKVRVVSQSGGVVSEMCVIGDAQNCIFEQAPQLAGGSVILYTPNWQSGILDISSLPNNEPFTVEFITARCGLGGHFGYAYVDDICLLHSTENLQGSIDLDPLYKNCPAFPFQVCGGYTIPNSGGISATVNSIVLKVLDANNAVVFTSSTPTIDLANNRFCFDIQAADLPNTSAADYNTSVTINYGLTQTNCTGTNFSTASCTDANPGWDISFLNCTNCDLDVHTAQLFLCDANHNGKEFFNLTDANSTIIANPAGLTFSYFATLADATADSNPIAAFTSYESPSAPVFVRVVKDATCFKIIAISLVVKNPSASISGILNVCSGSTTLTASPGASYLWYNSQTSQSIVVNAVGTYTVTVTDSFGCQAVGTVNILNSTVAVQPTLAITQPTCFVSTGTIAVTSPASDYSFDNGVTWSTNASMNNLSVGTYNIKIKTVAGCTSYSTPVTLVPFLSAFPDCATVQPQFCGDIGSITVTTPSSEYSFDDGLTWTTNNTKSNLPSGTYLVRVKDSFGCISNANSVVLNGEFLADPLYTFENPYCGTPGSITITTPAAAYSFDGGMTWQTSNTMGGLTVGNTIIKIRDARGCTSSNVYVYLSRFENSYPEYEIHDAGCGVYASITITTLGDFYSFDGGTTWTTNPVALNLVSGNTYQLKVRKGPSCASYTRSVTINSQYYPLPEPTDFATTLCDALNDGSEMIDLESFTSHLISNPATYTFQYYWSRLNAENDNSRITNTSNCNLSNNNNKVFVRVVSSFGCYAVVELSFTFLDSPVIWMQDRYPLCQFKTASIDVNPEFDSYLWSTGDITRFLTVSADGPYWVIARENHQTPNGLLVCESRKDFQVFWSNPATIKEIVIDDWYWKDNSITVNVTGLGLYDYSLDGNLYQDSNVFSGLPPGEYRVFVRDRYGCGVVDEEIFLLMYPYYFTPNDDTYNDTWKIKLSETERNFNIKIFDRHGKFLKQLGNNMGWDGTFNGAAMPADDYWFVVTREDGKVFKGHFALKR